MITKNELLKATHKGFYIYQRVLSYYYEDSLALGLSGKQCLPAQNPFNEGKLTLRIRLMDDVFCHQDYELPDFNGNAIDFAALHYKLEGDALLEKINLDMHLHLGEEKEKEKSYIPVYVMEMPSFSFYKKPITNTWPSKLMTLLDTFHLIKGDTYKERTLKLRSITDAGAASQFKRMNFDYVTFSGMFSKRSDLALVNHSGLMTLDFDHVDNLPQLKDILINDPGSDLGIDMSFDSPSGHGLKCIISIDVVRRPHHVWFEAAAHYLKKRYNLEVDRSGKDVSRACFLSHDPNVWIHPLYLI